MKTEIDDLIANAESWYDPATIGTHWEGCEKQHWRCALAKCVAALREQRDEIARLNEQRGTLICRGTTGKPEWTPVGRIIVDLEKRIEKAEAERDAAMKDAERYQFWRKHYSSRFVIVLAPGLICGTDLKFDATRPKVEAAGPDYERKVDAALDAALAKLEQEQGR